MQELRQFEVWLTSIIPYHVGKPLFLVNTNPHMRILLTLIAVVAFLGTTSAQETVKEKKRNKKARTESVSTPAAEPGTAVAPKAGCCAGKSASAQAACGSKAGDAKASTGEAATSTEGAAAPKAAGCCAGKSAEARATCHGKGEAHAHEHGEAAPAGEPAAAPQE